MRHTSEADCGVCGIDLELLHLGIPSLLVYTPTGGALGVYALIMDFSRENCSGGVFAGTYISLGEQVFSRVAANMISPTTARQRSIQLPHRLFHDLIEFLCAWYVI